MSYPAIIGVAGLMIVSVFTVVAHKPRIGANGEFSHPTSGLALSRAIDSTNADAEKPTTAIGLPTAPDDE